MKISSNKLLPLLFAAILLLAVFWKFFSLMSFTDPQMPLEKGEIVKLSAQTTLTQKFVANSDNLVKIIFLLGAGGIKEGNVVKMQITDENCLNMIREGYLVKSFLASGNLFEFQFDKIPDSNGKTFCIKAIFEPQSTKAKAIQFFSHTNDPTSISMKPAYENNHWWQNISELNQRISQYKPWFLKHFYLYTISFLFIILSIALVAILILI